MAVDISERKVEQHAFRLWLSWTIATTLGMVIGYLPAAFMVESVSLWVARILVPLLAGLLIGGAQWLVLRQYISASHDWILHHAGGWMVGYTLGLFVIQALSHYAFGFWFGFLFFGIIVALFQWPILRREIPHLASWILANVVGWTLGAFISAAGSGAIFQNTTSSLVASTIVPVAITGLVAGAITAFGLIWIVRQPEREDYLPYSGREGGGQ